jgi:hypothetical protein
VLDRYAHTQAVGHFFQYKAYLVLDHEQFAVGGGSKAVPYSGAAKPAKLVWTYRAIHLLLVMGKGIRNAGRC